MSNTENGDKNTAVKSGRELEPETGRKGPEWFDTYFPVLHIVGGIVGSLAWYYTPTPELWPVGLVMGIYLTPLLFSFVMGWSE